MAGLAAGALALAGTWLATCFPVKDPDLPLHLAYGRHMVERGEIDAVEPFSYTAQQVAYPNFEWGFDLIVYGLFQWGGANAVLVFKLCLVGCIATLTVATARRLAGPHRRLAGLSAAALLLASLPVLRPRLTMRPHVVGAALLTLHLYLARVLVDRAEGRRAWWIEAALVLSVPVWIAVHGSWPLAFLLTGAHFVLNKEHRRQFLRIGVLQAGALFINPYGVSLITFPFEHIAPPELRQYITEWQPLLVRLTNGQDVIVGGLAALAFTALAASMWRWWRDRQSSFPIGPEWACALAFIVPAILSYRFILAATLFLIPPLAATLGAGMTRLSGRLPSLATTLLMVTALGVFFGRLDAQEEPYVVGTGLDFSALPERAMDTVLDHALPGPVFNDFNSGDYLTWRLGTERKIAIDGRFLLYAEGFFDTYVAILKDPTLLDSHVATHDVQLAVMDWTVPRNRLVTAYLLQHDAWALVHFDEHQALFARGEARRVATAANLLLHRVRPAAHPDAMMAGPPDALASAEIARIMTASTPPFGQLLQVALEWRRWRSTGDAATLPGLIDAANVVVASRPELLYARLRRGQALLVLNQVDEAIRDLEWVAARGAGEEALQALDAARRR